MDHYVTARWDQAVRDALRSAEMSPMQLGKDDCVPWAAGIVQAVTGQHPVPEVVQGYTSRRKAAALRRTFGPTLTEATAAIAARQGWREVLPEDAVGPAVGVATTPEGLSAVVLYRSWWIGRSRSGWCAAAASAVRRAWEVV